MNLKYFKEAKLNGCRMKAYIDQGSKCVTIKKSETDKLDFNYEKLETPVVIRDFGNGEMQPVGIFHAELIVDNARAMVHVLVVPDEFQTVALLVGQPFTEQEHITIVRRKDQLLIFEEGALNEGRVESAS